MKIGWWINGGPSVNTFPQMPSVPSWWTTSPWRVLLKIDIHNNEDGFSWGVGWGIGLVTKWGRSCPGSWTSWGVRHRVGGWGEGEESGSSEKKRWLLGLTFLAAPQYPWSLLESWNPQALSDHLEHVGNSCRDSWPVLISGNMSASTVFKFWEVS